MAAPNLRAIRDWVNKKIGVVDSSIEKTNQNVTNVKESVMLSGQQVYLDEKEGVYGFNTSSERGADTFTPFKSGSSGGGTGGVGTYKEYSAGYMGGDAKTVNLKNLTTKYAEIDVNAGIFIYASSISLDVNYKGSLRFFSSIKYDKTSGVLTINPHSGLGPAGDVQLYVYYLCE